MSGKKYVASVTQYIIIIHGKTKNGMTNQGKKYHTRRQSLSLILKTDCIQLKKYLKGLDRLSMKIFSSGASFPIMVTDCVRKSIKWSKFPQHASDYLQNLLK